MERRIIELIEPAACENNGVDTPGIGQCMLMYAKTFAHDAFDAIALIGEPDVLLGDHKTQPGPLKKIGPREN